MAARKRTACQMWTRARLHYIEQILCEGIRRGNERAHIGLEARRFGRPPALHTPHPRCDLQRLLLVGSAGGWPHLAHVLVATVQLGRKGRCRLFGIQVSGEEGRGRIEAAVDERGINSVVDHRKESDCLCRIPDGSGHFGLISGQIYCRNLTPVRSLGCAGCSITE